MGNDLSVNESNKGPSYFKKYLCYADALNGDNEEESKVILNSLVDVTSNVKDCDDSLWFEEELYKELKDKIDVSKFEIWKHVEIGSFVINVAIYDKENNKYLLGIDCSNGDETSNDSEISDDIYKQYYLLNRGWNINKVWISDWFMCKEKVINNILIKLG